MGRSAISSCLSNKVFSLRPSLLSSSPPGSLLETKADKKCTSRIRLPFNGCFCVPEGGPCPDGAADKAGKDPYIYVGTNFSPYQITRRAETEEVLKQPADRDYWNDYYNFY